MAKYTADDIDKLLKGTTTKLMVPAINNNKKSEKKTDNTSSVSTQNNLPSLSDLKNRMNNQNIKQSMNNLVASAVEQDNKQKLAKLTNQHMSNPTTMSAADTQYNKLLKWSQPEYKMSDADKKEFKSIEKEYAAKNPSYSSHSIGYSPEQSANDQMMTNLANKVNPVTSFAQGALSTVTPVAETINSGVAKLGGEKAVAKANANSKSLNDALKGSQTQHPVAYGAGQFAGQAAEYAAAGAIGESLGATQALQGGLQNLGMSEKAAGILADQGINYAQDLALSEIPSAINDKQNGLSNDQILHNFGKNAVQDIGYNAAVPIVGKALKSGANAYLTKVLGSQDYINNIAKNIDAYQFADNPETKKILDPARQLSESAGNVGKSILNDADNGISNIINSKEAIDSIPKVNTQTELPNTIENIPEVKQVLQEPALNTDTPKIERGYAKSVISKTDLPDEIKSEFKNNPRLYERLHNADTAAKADSYFDENNLTASLNNFKQLINERDPASLKLGYDLAQKYIDSGQRDIAIGIIDEMAEKLTKSGQFSQAAVMTMIKNDPMTALSYIQKEIKKINEEGGKKFPGWVNVALTDNEIDAFKTIDKGDAQSIQNTYNQIGKRIAKEYPSTLWEKITELRKTGMLLNSRTHIKNTASNAILLPIRSASDRVSAIGQNIYKIWNNDFETTQSVLGGTKEQKAIAGKIFDEQIKPMLEDSNKYADTTNAVPSLKNSIRDNKQVFKDSKSGTAIKEALTDDTSVLNRITGGRMKELFDKTGDSLTGSTLENLRRFDYYLLSKVEDDPFVKANFKNRLASYMKAQNVTDASNVSQEAINAAYDEALKATFKDDNALTSMMSGIKKNLGAAGDILLPFTKTPANLAVRGIDYSPVGFITSLRKYAKTPNAEKDVSKLFDDLSKNVTGTAAIAMGIYLASKGIITGPLSDNKKKSNFQKNHGMQAYSIKLGDNYYSYDWAQPASIPLILGATIYNAMASDDKELEDASVGKKILDYSGKAAGAAVNAWIDLSPLKSIKDLMGASDTAGTFAENAAESLADFPNSFIPSAVGATARIVDNTQRSTYSKGALIKTKIDEAKAKIPFVSKTLPASYDTWGNVKTRASNTPSAVFNQTVNPGTYSNNRKTDLDDDLMKLDNNVDGESMYPLPAEWSLEINGKNKNLSNEENSEYQHEMGTQAYSLAHEFIKNSDMYNKLTDDSKVNVLSQLYGLSKAQAQSKLFGKEIKDGDTYDTLNKIYEESGKKGVIDYVSVGQAIKEAGVEPNDRTREIYSTDGIEGVKKYAQQNNMLKSIGLSRTDKNRSTLEDNGEDYMKTYATLDSIAKSDKNNKTKDGSDTSFASSTLTEQLSYIKQAKLSDDDAGKVLFNGMSDDEKEKLSTLHDSYGDKGIYQYEQTKIDADSDNSGSLSVKELVPYLKSQNMSESQKADYFVGLVTLSDKAKAIQSSKGNAGVYEYYQYKNDADTDGNGSVTKNEASAFLLGSSLSSDDKTYWFKQMCPSVKKIPKF